MDFLVKSKGFNEQRVRATVKRIEKSKSTGAQGRLDGFFTVTPSSNTSATAKRPATGKDADKNKKAKTGGGFRGGKR